MGLVVVAGGFTLDDTVLRSNEIRRRAPGGNALYAAVGAKVWSDSVGLLGVVGYDWPEEYLVLLKDKGFTTAGITRVDHPNIKMWALHEDNGGRQLIYKLDSGHNQDLDPRVEFVPDVYRQANGLHVAALPFTTQQELVSSFRSWGVGNISLDVVNIPGRIDSSPYRNLEHLKGVSMFLPSLEEVHDLWGKSRELSKLIQDIVVRVGLETMAVKMGAQGCTVYDRARDAVWHVPIFPVEAKDTTGAGDSFCGGFLAGYEQTGDALEAAVRGTVSASFVVQDFGALHALDTSRQEVIRRANSVRKGVQKIRGGR